MCRDCFMMFIPVSMFARRGLCLLSNCIYGFLYEDPKSERLRRTQAIAALMFQFCGMSFADLAHLEKSALEQNVLRYNRIQN